MNKKINVRTIKRYQMAMDEWLKLNNWNKLGLCLKYRLSIRFDYQWRIKYPHNDYKGKLLNHLCKELDAHNCEDIGESMSYVYSNE